MSILALVTRAPRPRPSSPITGTAPAVSAPVEPSPLIDLGPWPAEPDMTPRAAREWMALASAGGVRRSSAHVAYCGS